MASAWGGTWGASWGNSWGAVAAAVQELPRGGPALYYRPNRTRRRGLRELLEEIAERADVAPPPVKITRKAADDLVEEAALVGQLAELRAAIDAELVAKDKAEYREGLEIAAAQTIKRAMERHALELEEEDLLLM